MLLIMAIRKLNSTTLISSYDCAFTARAIQISFSPTALVVYTYFHKEKKKKSIYNISGCYNCIVIVTTEIKMSWFTFHVPTVNPLSAVTHFH